MVSSVRRGQRVRVLRQYHTVSVVAHYERAAEVPTVPMSSTEQDIINKLLHPSHRLAADCVKWMRPARGSRRLRSLIKVQAIKAAVAAINVATEGAYSCFNARVLSESQLMQADQLRETTTIQAIVIAKGRMQRNPRAPATPQRIEARAAATPASRVVSPFSGSSHHASAPNTKNAKPYKIR